MVGNKKRQCTDGPRALGPFTTDVILLSHPLIGDPGSFSPMSALTQLVQPSPAKEQVRHGVEGACRSLASVNAAERDAAGAALLQFAHSPDLVDESAFLLGCTDDASVHFHVLGALLSQLGRLDVSDEKREVRSLVSLSDWLLQAATVRRDAPAYVASRQMRAIVLLAKRAGGHIAALDPAPIVALVQHATSLIQSEHKAVGLQLALAIAQEMDVSALPGVDADGVQVGLSTDEHVWAHAVVQVHGMPVLLPATLQTLYASQDDIALLLPAALATSALLEWDWNAIPLLPAAAQQYAPAQLLEAVQRPGCESEGVPSGVADILLSPDLPGLLGSAARAAGSAADAMPDKALAARNAAHALRGALQHVAAYAPAENEGKWSAQRLAFAKALGTYVDETATRVAQSSVLTTELDVLRILAQIYQGLVSGHSGRVILAAGASEVEGLLHALAHLTQASFHAALYLAPSCADEESLAEADAAVTEVLALWRALLCALESPDAPPVLEAVHSHVRDHVVLAYQAGRLHAAQAAAANDSEMREEQASDAEAYDEQLTLYAALGRTCLGDAVGALAAAQVALQASLSAGPSDATWEQLHWLAMLTGHLVADAPAAETVSLPDAAVHSDTATQDALLALLHAMSLVLLPALLPHGPNDAHAASPQVVASLLVMTARWVPTYLLRTDSARVGAPLTGASGEHVLDTLLGEVRTALDVWRSDADVLIAAAALLESFAHTPGAMSVLLARDAMQGLVRDALTSLESLPDAAHAPLLRAFVRCLDTARDGPVSASDARAVYYPLVLEAVQARMASAVRASTAPQLATSVHSALRLVEVLAGCADPHTSRAVHEQLIAQLPAVVEIAQALMAHPDVLCAALQAVRAVLCALEELEVDHGPVAHSVHALLATVRPTLGDADAEEVWVLYLGTICALAQVCAPTDLAPLCDAGGVRTSDPAAVSAASFAAAMSFLSLETLAIVPVREALAECTVALLLKTSAVLLGSADGTPSDTPSPLVLLASGMRTAPLAVPSANPLEVVLRTAALLAGTADTTIDVQVTALAPAVGLLCARLPAVPPNTISAPQVQQSVDRLAWDLVRALFLRPLHLPLLSSLVLMLRSITLARVHAEWLGGQSSYVHALEVGCASVPLSDAHRAVLGEGVQGLVQQILTSQPPSPQNVAPALAARMHAKEEQKACLALCRAVRPQLLQARGVLCVQ